MSLDENEHRTQFLRYTSYVAGYLGLFFAGYNMTFVQDDYTASVVLLLFSIFSFFTIHLISRIQIRFIPWLLRTFALLLSTLILYVHFSAAAYLGFIFTFTIPGILYFLTGRVWGGWSNLVFLVIASFGFGEYYWIYADFPRKDGLFINYWFVYIIIWLLTAHYERLVFTQLHRFKDEAIIDSLTGVFNRKALQEKYNLLMKLHNTVFILLLDIDYFKKVNDTYGHQAGDEALVQFVQLLESDLSYDQKLFRLGGEEFCILMGEEPQQVVEFAEAIRKKVETHVMHCDGNQLSITTSIGIAESNVSGEQGLIKALSQADVCLYQAKESGRNKVLSCFL